MNLPPELLPLVNASPWAFIAGIAIYRLGPPFASIFAIRLARNDKERAAFLEHRRIECRPATRQRRELGSDKVGEDE
jgi:hypothetical protein